MIVAACLSWLGIGLLWLTDAARATRVLGFALLARSPWVLRSFALVAFAASPWAARAEARGALVLVAALVAAMAASSVAALLAPLRPRWYAASIPVAALLALFFSVPR